MSAEVIALFDLDHTLLAVDGDEARVEFLIEERILDQKKFALEGSPQVRLV